jgi:hypothetical protein
MVDSYAMTTARSEKSAVVVLEAGLPVQSLDSLDVSQELKKDHGAPRRTTAQFPMTLFRARAVDLVEKVRRGPPWCCSSATLFPPAAHRRRLPITSNPPGET